MNTFGEFLRYNREQLGLPLRKVAAELDIDTSILSKIERGERVATKEMLETFSKTLDIPQKTIEVEFIKSYILTDLSDLLYLSDGLAESLNVIKKNK
ncbi:MAG: XRE family transcriptional regulator [Bacteroidetes bacterium 38_7]|nr:MAG: XRE family transcriptional regulator [Bacteroidetes bacterium 38_7]HBH11799.1 XRE family transcriptional regulator [Clostridiales bacterium]